MGLIIFHRDSFFTLLLFFSFDSVFSLFLQTYIFSVPPLPSWVYIVGDSSLSDGADDGVGGHADDRRPEPAGKRQVLRGRLRLYQRVG